MADKTGIEWTNATWNPVVGCTHVSAGCDNCYAAREASGRLRGVPVYAGLAEGGRFTGEVRCLSERLDQPLRWKKPRRVFVNSMSDLFHKDVPDDFVGQVFDVMLRADHHQFQLLTKRPQRVKDFVHLWLGESWAQWIPNLWLGTSIESARYAFRADHLRATPAAVRFLSLEPLLGPLPTIDLTDIDWVIVGGESGPGARPMHPDWVREIRDRCVEAGVSFFFKQWGEWVPWYPYARPATHRVTYGGHVTQNGPTCLMSNEELIRRVGKKAAGRTLDGRTWDEYPQGGN